MVLLLGPWAPSHRREDLGSPKWKVPWSLGSWKAAAAALRPGGEPMTVSFLPVVLSMALPPPLSFF